MKVLKQLFLLLALVLIVVPSAAQEKRVPRSREDITLSFAPLVKRTAPAVVNVYARQLVQQQRPGGRFMDDPFFRRFLDPDGSFGRPRERVANSLGSGVIVESSGVIVTNNHVVRNGIDIRVVLADKREFEAKLLLADERTDLAILTIEVNDNEQFPVLELADSDDLEVGDLVLAIGNPFGVGQTVTSGIVSALARTKVGITDYQFFIQTDAAINPGNSGGALVNMRGELVGINTAIFSRSGGSIGIGFAIPANMVRTVVQSAGSGGKVKRAWLGAELQDVTQEIADSLGFARPEGALVVQLHPKSPLALAGLRRGDVITAIDDRVVENAQELGYRVATARIGDTKFIEFRRGGKTQQVGIRLISAPETIPRSETEFGPGSPFGGLTVANLSPAVAEELDLPSDVTGVVATNVSASPAARFFRRGDVIVEVNGAAVGVVADLKAAITKGPSIWDIAILRDSRTLRIRLR
jgi:Do/DeqQ family serine protease